MFWNRVSGICDCSVTISLICFIHKPSIKLFQRAGTEKIGSRFFCFHITMRAVFLLFCYQFTWNCGSYTMPIRKQTLVNGEKAGQ